MLIIIKNKLIVLRNKKKLKDAQILNVKFIKKKLDNIVNFIKNFYVLVAFKIIRIILISGLNLTKQFYRIFYKKQLLF